MSLPPDGAGDPARLLYRFLLRAYPRWFRERYERDLVQAFDDRRHEPRFLGAVGGVRLVLFLLRDFATSLPLARKPGPRGHPGMDLMNDFLRDVRHTVRMLIKSPAFTFAAVTTLALGIGLNAATFSAIRGVLLRPLEGADHPERLVQIYRSYPGLEYGSSSIPHYQDLRDRTGEAFESVAAWYYAPMSLSVEGASERLVGTLVSANFFQTYGVRPDQGRFFHPDAEAVGPGAHPVAVLGHDFWRARFGSDPGIVGRTIVLNGRSFEVVGVAPPDFKGPVSYASIPVYVPLMMQPWIDTGAGGVESRGNNMMNVVARLRDGADLAAARYAVDAAVASMKEEDPGAYENQVASALVLNEEAGLHPTLRGAQVGMSAVIMTVVGLLLLVACVNVANLFLARARERRREMGIRLSLGAGRGRLVRQLLTESLVFSVLAGAAGMLLATVAIRALAVFRPPIDGPWQFNVEIDGSVAAFAAGVTLLATLVFGLVPALQAARPDTVSSIKGDATPGSRSRMTRTLVVGQMALSLLLLIGAGLFLRSLEGALDIDPGFAEPADAVIASVDPGLQGLEPERSRQVLDRLLEGVRALPSVSRAGLTTLLPLGLNSSDRGVDIPGYDFAPGEARNIRYSIISEGYLEAMGVRLLEGRGFTRQDDSNGAPVIIVNERFADRFWRDGSALGHVVTTAGKDREVIGVVATGKYQSLGEPATEYMYLPHREMMRTAVTLVARTSDHPTATLSGIRNVVHSIDPDMPVFDVRTMEDHLGFALLPARLAGSVLGLFGLLGLGLAAVGIYGVMAFSVAQRKREMGIRAALGADRREVVGIVLKEGLVLAGVGAALGLVAAAAATRLVAGMLYGVSALDPVAFLGLPALLVGVAMLAVYLPARRAARADPMTALKTD